MADRPGFTLIEILVALAVFALAAMALLNLSGEGARSAARVETGTLGGIVAENLAVEAMTATTLPVGETSGQVEMAGQAWRWRRIVAGTEVPGMGRIDIAVYSDEGLAADRTLFRSAGA
jgi:general secretion pathway protein I